MDGLSINELSKKYLRNIEDYALKDFSINYKENQIIGLLGDNGAGKTTLLKCITDLVYPTQGTILMNSEDLQRMSSHKRNKSIFFVAEGTRSLWWRLTVVENIKFVCQMKWGNWDKVKECLDSYLETMNLLEKKNVLVGKLSRGQQQKVCLLLAIVSESNLIIMDEPTLGLDVSTKQEIVELILEVKQKTASKIFIISSHDMDFISKVADRISILKNGKLIADGTIAELGEIIQNRYTSFEILDELNKEKLESLCKCFEVKNIHKVNGTCTFESEGDVIANNNIIDFLRNQNIHIISINQHEMNLERLYTELQRVDEKHINPIEY